MSREVLLAIWILVGVALLTLLIVGWRGRLRRQRSAVSPLPEVPELGTPQAVLGGKYVATTVADAPLDRIVAHGLAFRGFATIQVHDSGILVDRTGEAALWIARGALVGIGRSTWTIDRVLERDGLHFVRWRLGDREVDTYLRLDEPSAFDAATADFEEVTA